MGIWKMGFKNHFPYMYMYIFLKHAGHTIYSFQFLDYLKLGNVFPWFKIESLKGCIVGSLLPNSLSLSASQFFFSQMLFHLVFSLGHFTQECPFYCIVALNTGFLVKG